MQRREIIFFHAAYDFTDLDVLTRAAYVLGHVTALKISARVAVHMNTVA